MQRRQATLTALFTSSSYESFFRNKVSISSLFAVSNKRCNSSHDPSSNDGFDTLERLPMARLLVFLLLHLPGVLSRAISMLCLRHFCEFCSLIHLFCDFDA